MDTILILAAAAAAATAGTARLILQATPPTEPTTAITPFPAAQVRGPALVELRRKSQLTDPESLALYTQYLEEQLARLGHPAPSQASVFGFTPAPANVEKIPMGQRFGTVHPVGSPPSSPLGFTPAPLPVHPQIHPPIPSQPPEDSPPSSPPEEFGEDAVDQVMDLLLEEPAIANSKIAFQVWGLTKADKSGNPSSRWQKAMALIKDCKDELEKEGLTQC